MAGDFKRAAELHGKLFPLAKGLLALETNPIPIKTAMAVKGLVAEEFRLPLCPMQPANRQRLCTLLAEQGIG